MSGGTTKEWSRAYYLANRESIKAKTRAYAVANAEKVAAYQRDYRAKNAEKVAAPKKKWHDQHYARYYAQNHAAILARHLRRYHEDIAASRARARLYRKTYAPSPEVRQRIRLCQRLHEYRLKGATGHATTAQIEARIAFYGGRCAYCGDEATTLDHVIPLAKGGTNWPSNLRPACLTCNSSKRDTPLRAFLERRSAHA